MPTYACVVDDIDHARTGGHNRVHAAETAVTGRSPRPGSGAHCTSDTGPILRPEPVTDPHGFPAFAAVPRPAQPGRSAVLDPRGAGALAAAFALDYLSWDETDPDRRGRVMAGYLPGWAEDLAYLGWPGHGRQRAELALPGPARPDGGSRTVVDVRVRVTPYRSTGEHAGPPPPESAGESVGAAAAAPSLFARGWQNLPSWWVRINVPIVALDDGQLVVDVWEEVLDSGHAPWRHPQPYDVDRRVDATTDNPPAPANTREPGRQPFRPTGQDST